MTKKEQAIEVLTQLGLAENLGTLRPAIQALREGLKEFEGDELRAVREAYQQVLSPEIHAVVAELQQFADAIDSPCERDS